MKAAKRERRTTTTATAVTKAAVKPRQERFMDIHLQAEEGTEEDLTCSLSLALCPTIAIAVCLLPLLLVDKEGYNFKRQKQEKERNTLASGEFRLAFFF